MLFHTIRVNCVFIRKIVFKFCRSVAAWHEPNFRLLNSVHLNALYASLRNRQLVLSCNVNSIAVLLSELCKQLEDGGQWHSRTLQDNFSFAYIFLLKIVLGDVKPDGN